jgi:hypothetical protein
MRSTQRSENCMRRNKHLAAFSDVGCRRAQLTRCAMHTTIDAPYVGGGADEAPPKLKPMMMCREVDLYQKAAPASSHAQGMPLPKCMREEN